MSDNNHSSHFIVPVKYYIRTFIALLILTVITVAVSRVDLGILNTPMALFIALIKMSLVASFFMALRWEKGINPILALGSVIAVIIFFLFTFSDVAFRGDIYEEEAIPFIHSLGVGKKGPGHHKESQSNKTHSKKKTDQ